MENFKVEFYFTDEDGMVLYSVIEFVEGGDPEDAANEAAKVCESMCAQDFKVYPNNAN